MQKQEGKYLIWASFISALAIIAAAFISYWGAKAQIETPINATRTAKAEEFSLTQPSIFITQISPEITVTNKLGLSIEIMIGGIGRGTIENYSTKMFVLDGYPVSFDWTIVKQITSGGSLIGDDMSGHYDEVYDGNIIIIDNIVVEQTYFYPIISNKTDKSCKIIINQGYINEYDTNAQLSPYQNKVGFGYYELYDNSNITLDCDGDFYWWGIRPGETEKSNLVKLVEPESGVVTLEFSP